MGHPVTMLMVFLIGFCFGFFTCLIMSIVTDDNYCAYCNHYFNKKLEERPRDEMPKMRWEDKSKR